MPILLRLLAALCLAVVALAIPSPPAHAAGDVVKSLSVHYDVRPDGAIDVRYELDWDFGEKGRRGIQFDIVTRESWEGDTTKDALYDVSGIKVDSPTGAPTGYQEIEEGAGSDGTLRLRVGDPDRTLDERRHTYVISFTLQGGMRTFDGVPELHLDVTGLGYPEIEQFDVTVEGPAPVERARCLVGDRECEATVDGGAAKLSGRDVDGATITAVASFPAGSVSNAEPLLEDRRLQWPTLVGHDVAYEVRPDGTTLVTADLTYQLPEHNGRPHRLDATIPLRRAFSRTEDIVYTIGDVEAVDASGEPLETKLHPPWYGSARVSNQDARVDLRLETQEREAGVRLSYIVDGAVTVDGDTARFRWPLDVVRPQDAHQPSYSWTMPGPVSSASVNRPHIDGDRDYPELTEALIVDGRTASLTGLDAFTYSAWVDVRFPGATVPGASPRIEPSLDHTAWQRSVATGWGGGGALLGLGAIGVVLSRRRLVRDLRYLQTPPGVRGNPEDVGASPSKVNIPVRFEEPDGVDVALGGLLIDRTYKPKHLSALLISLAAKGAITLGLPVRAGQVDATRAAKGFERNFFSAIPRHETALDNTDLLKLKRRITNEQKDRVEHSGLFLPPSEGQRLRHATMALFGLAIPVAIWAFYFLTSPEGPVTAVPHYVAHNFLLSALVTVGSLAAFVLVWISHRPALSAEGTVLRDQLAGLEQYIRTAEQHQLRYEESQDIFRRFLPWAVLFDLTERWTNACRAMAEQGRIPDVDASFAGGITGVNTLVSGLTSSARSASTSSSGGSGGSSGFSSSGGGSGGGGTGASSW